MTDDNTIEISETAADSLAHLFGFQQWLGANAPVEHLQNKARHVSAALELADEMGVIGDAGEDEVIFQSRGVAVKHLWQFVGADISVDSEGAEEFLESDMYGHRVAPEVEAYIAGVPITEKGWEAVR